MVHCWFPCSGHKLSQSRHRSAFWTPQNLHNVRPSCPRIPRTPSLPESDTVVFLSDDESRFLFLWVEVTSLWYFTVRSFCLKVRLKCTGGLRSDDCDHWQTYLQVDIRTSDYLLKSFDWYVLGFMKLSESVFTWECWIKFVILIKFLTITSLNCVYKLKEAKQNNKEFLNLFYQLTL